MKNQTQREITFVKIPSKYGIVKEIPIESLTKRQYEIQLENCEKQLLRYEEEFKALKESNKKLSVNVRENKIQLNINEKKMIKIEKTSEFVEKLEFILVNHYNEKFKSNEIVAFENSLQYEHSY